MMETTEDIYIVYIPVYVSYKFQFQILIVEYNIVIVLM